MSVLIKGVEMPKCCNACWVLDDYGDYPRCRITDEQRGYNFKKYEKRMDNCPLVSIPPHAQIAGWIPVEERLPCLTTPVLVTDGIEVDIAWMYGVPPRWITSYTAIDEDKLTHWMPLPQTPKGE